MAWEKRGKLIAIEGTDGSGKATQVRELIERAEIDGLEFSTFSFPRYNTPTGKIVREYLQGKYGDPVEINPAFAAKLYAADRQAASPEINSLLLKRTDIICDRYTGSNLAHQGAKLTGDLREGFVKWCEDLEFKQLGIPKPDLTILLNLPAEQAIKAMEKQAREKDGHEASRNYQQKVVETYLWLAKTKPDWILIDCMNGDERRKIDDITEEMWEKILQFMFK